MDVIKDFLLQIALVAMPVFGFQLPWEKNKKLIMVLLWGLTLLICMSFPIYYGEGYRLDLRVIPLMLAFLYGGTGSGALLAALLILYRLYIGFDAGFITSMLTLLTGVPPMILMRKTFSKANAGRRVVLAILLAATYSVMGIGWTALLRGSYLDVLSVQLIQLTCVLIMTGVVVRMNEFIYHMQFMRLEAERLRTISELTSLFAHEIRNPMQTTRGFLQLLDSPELSSKKRQFIKLSIDELDRANSIISDYLAVGKPASEERQRIELASELSRAANVIEAYAANQGVNIKIEAVSECWINVNPQQLRQLLINLLKNAIESMPDGGSIHTSVMKETGNYAIRIKDEGVGMTPEQVNKLGSPFYSLKSTGTGLGMVVCYQIVKQFGGDMLVSSELGSGTEVIVQLPNFEFAAEARGWRRPRANG
ncbi:two-component system sporulation sensor kinase B [Paenibacillus phyllosphaerae]|uniref:histidine kinase n=1 Tax=Paenibacillus phyllosphaerae TaxID=274593 RepID=A0A7W5B1M9_9BACL|nr:sensor histidine kinase [Paenibacillus phyllosphaerae]MBB3112800.1 two-component system sporulation sensor kinase B [Paenibacillus phyllosphaerae]